MNNFLLTYDCINSTGGDNFIASNYAWFETEEQLVDFVNKNKKVDCCFSVNEAVEVLNSREVKL